MDDMAVCLKLGSIRSTDIANVNKNQASAYGELLKRAITTGTSIAVIRRELSNS